MRAVKDWWRWFKVQPFSFKWILWLVLLRPFIDMFWFVKETSIVSPLQVTGLLTFALAVIYGLSKRVGVKVKFPVSLLLLTLLVAFNLILILAETGSMKMLGQFIRTLTPLVVLFYMFKVIKNEQRFNGFLITYLVSSIFPLSLLAYETVVGPISAHEVLAESRGGGFRLSGPYADMFNYLAYLIGDFLIMGYFFIRSIGLRRKPPGLGKIVLVIALFAIGIRGLQHQATWIVFFVLISVISLYSINNNRVKGYAIILLIPVVLAGPVVVGPMFIKLFSKEIKAYSGEGSQERVLNGRFVRWDKYFELWVDTDMIPKLIGVSVSDLPAKTKMIMTSGGMHSDYVRFLFGGGVVGLFALLAFYATVFIRRRRYRKPESFFIACCIIVLLLYSVSSNPLGGIGNMIYLLCAGIAVSMQHPRVFYGQLTDGKQKLTA